MTETEETGEKEEAGKFGKAPDASLENIKKAPEVAISMFSIEIVTKMILYYFHERIWYVSNWGVVKPKN